jgi:hypothetical protein
MRSRGLGRFPMLQWRRWLHSVSGDKTDYYAVLGVARSANPAEIKAAYYLQSKRLHPDLHNNAPGKAEQFALLNQAYSVLSQARASRLPSRWPAPTRSPSSHRSSFSRPTCDGATTRAKRTCALRPVQVCASLNE